MAAAAAVAAAGGGDAAKAAAAAAAAAAAGNDAVVRVLHGRWVVPMTATASAVRADSRAGYLEHHSVVVGESGNVVAVLPTAEARERYCGGKSSSSPSSSSAVEEVDLSDNHVLLPGLINSHTHSPMTLLRAFADEVPLQEWLTHYMWPAEGVFADESFVRDGSVLSVEEMLRCGVTAFNDMYFYPMVTAEVAAEAGIRAVVGAPILQFPTPFASTADEYIARAVETAAAYKDHPLIRVSIAPHAPYTVGDDEFKKAAAAAAEHDLVVHTHLQETAKEVSDHVESPEHGGKRPFARLQELGLIDKRLIAAHMTQLTADEIDTCAKSGVSICHCPESNLKLRSGVCPVARLIRAGVNVCLGTDGAASNDDLDLFGELRTAALVDKMFASSEHGGPLTAYEWLQIATINGAKALGLDDECGRLAPGYSADIVAVQMVQEPVYNPVTNLVCVGTNSVDHVWIRGRHVVGTGGKVLTLDTGDVTRRAREWGARISSWDRERRTHDPVQAQDAHAKATALIAAIGDKVPTPEQRAELEEAKARCEKVAGMLFHQKFFARLAGVGCAVEGESMDPAVAEAARLADDLDKQHDAHVAHTAKIDAVLAHQADEKK